MSKSEYYGLGQSAFHAGINAPCHDPELMQRIGNNKIGMNLEALKAWNAGWTTEQLKAEVAA
jgi:hypothetical protein